MCNPLTVITAALAAKKTAAEPVKPVSLVNPVNPTNPVNQANPVNPLKPVQALPLQLPLPLWVSPTSLLMGRLNPLLNLINRQRLNLNLNLNSSEDMLRQVNPNPDLGNLILLQNHILALISKVSV